MELVWDDRLQRPLARKIVTLEGELGSPSHVDQRRLARFVDEARIAARLQHPSIVMIQEVGIAADGRPFFTMPVVRGSDFAAVVRRVHDATDEDWTLARAIGVLIAVCDALSYAHAKGVIHRDLKPENIMVGRFGETYVMDWGLAKILPNPSGPSEFPAESLEMESLRDRIRGDENRGFLTMDGDILGTPAYMAPEQAEGQLDRVGRLSDVYSLGVLLYELLAGRGPFDGGPRHAAPEEVLMAVRTTSPPSLSGARRRPPAELISICEKAMARQPEDRYADMAELADDLRAVVPARFQLPNALCPLNSSAKPKFSTNAHARQTMILIPKLLHEPGSEGFPRGSRRAMAPTSP